MLRAASILPCAAGEGDEVNGYPPSSVGSIFPRRPSSSPMILGEISGAELESYEAAEKAAKEEGRYFETFGLKDCAADCVWLEPCWTRITDSTAEIVIK